MQRNHILCPSQNMQNTSILTHYLESFHNEKVCRFHSSWHETSNSKWLTHEVAAQFLQFLPAQWQHITLEKLINHLTQQEASHPVANDHQQHQDNHHWCSFNSNDVGHGHTKHFCNFWNHDPNKHQHLFCKIHLDHLMHYYSDCRGNPNHRCNCNLTFHTTRNSSLGQHHPTLEQLTNNHPTASALHN